MLGYAAGVLSGSALTVMAIDWLPFVTISIGTLPNWIPF